MFNNRVEYTLKSRLGIFKLDIDPMGWEETETTLGRSLTTYGIFITLSNNLRFTGKAKDFILLNYEILGVNGKVELHRREKHPQTDEWELSKGFPRELEFSTMKEEDNKLTIDVEEGKLRTIFASQIREKYELNRIESISGDAISPLGIDKVTIKGRDIYLLSTLSQATSTFTTKSGEWDSGGDLRESFHPLPLQVDANSDPENIQAPQESYSLKNRWVLNSGNMFFHKAERDRGLTKLKLKTSFKVVSIDGNRAEDVNVKLVLDRYLYDEEAQANIHQERTVLKDLGFPQVNDTISYNSEEIILEPKLNESFALGLYQVGDYGGGIAPTYDGWANFTYSGFTGSLTWAEDSFYPRTQAPFLTAYDVGQRLTEIFTGKRKFKSDLLSSGSWKDLGLTCGGWLRNLKIKTEEGEEKDWPLTISFEDFYKSIHAVTPVGYGIVTKGAKQFIALENIRYFFQPFVTIKLGQQVSKIKRSVAGEFLFTSITTGYTKGGNYEKPLGLDEPNIQATCISPLRLQDTPYDVLGSSRADSYAVEDARRMQRENYADQDTPYDKDNFLLDTKFKIRSNLKNYYELRLWQEDFEVPPTGIYSPETAFNLRLSPAQNKMRHSSWFNSGLYKYPSDKIRYANTEGNSELETKEAGKSAIKENADVLISELSNPIFQPQWIEFEYPLEHEVVEQLFGTTEINGKEITNHYGLVEFINDKGVKERGFLFDAKIKNTINFTLLKSYGL